MRPLSALLLLSQLSFCLSFYNPIVEKGADPWIISFKNKYYYSRSGNGGVEIWSSSDLVDWRNAKKHTISMPGNFTDVWAPEIHRINGQFYVYVAADSGGKNERHRMYVLQSKDSEDPMVKWELKGKLSTADDNWAIDGTVFRYPGNGKLYYIWSGWSSPKYPLIQNLYIAELKDPLTVSSQRVLLREPSKPWMRFQNYGINEGPEVLIHKNRTFLIYSASASWTEHYCLGIMGIDLNKDPLKPSDWWRKEDGPIMQSAPKHSVYGPGHASYVNDKSGQTWVVYHAMKDRNGGWAGRSVRTQPITFHPDGTPVLPVPQTLSVRIPNPK